MNQDFQDLLHALCEAEAKFLVVGAYALAVHGKPRATGDIDIWVKPSPENARRVYAALEKFGAPLHELVVEDLSSPDVVFQMGLPPRRIDILTDITGVTFADAWPHRVETKFGEVSVPVLGVDQLIENKRAIGRTRDLADIEELEALLDE